MNNVIDFIQRRAERACTGGRTPLFVSHLRGHITSDPHGQIRDHGDRLMRIRDSLTKIDTLMAELKHMAQHERRNRQ